MVSSEVLHSKRAVIISLKMKAFIWFSTILCVFVYVGAEMKMEEDERCEPADDEFDDCLVYFMRYTYDPLLNECQKYVYCSGKERKFDSLEECKEVCVKKQPIPDPDDPQRYEQFQQQLAEQQYAEEAERAAQEEAERIVTHRDALRKHEKQKAS